MTTEIPPEPRYMVTVAIPVDADNPADAAQEFARHITTYGLASLTYNVEDRDGNDFYLATLNGTYASRDDVLSELEELDDDELTDEDRESLDRVAERVEAVIAEAPIIGKCARCGDEEVALLDGGLCAKCTEDIQGVPA